MQILGRLADVLAELYPDTADARRLAQEAGLVAEQIDLSGPAIRVWYNVIGEAENQAKMLSLFSVVRDEYPGHRNFIDVAFTYVEDKTGQGERPTRLARMNGDGLTDLRQRVRKLEEDVQQLHVDVAVMLRDVSLSSALSGNTLLIAIGIAIAMFLALYATRL